MNADEKRSLAARIRKMTDGEIASCLTKDQIWGVLIAFGQPIDVYRNERKIILAITLKDSANGFPR